MSDLPVDQQDDQWTLVTFGVAVTDIGRRDATFNPWRPQELMRIIVDLRGDQAHLGDLVTYNTHPQPMNIAGEKSVVLIVSVEIPGTEDHRNRAVLVHETSVPDVQVRSSHYAARLFDGSTACEIRKQLGTPSALSTICSKGLWHKTGDCQHGRRCSL